MNILRPCSPYVSLETEFVFFVSCLFGSGPSVPPAAAFVPLGLPLLLGLNSVVGVTSLKDHDHLCHF